MSLRLVTYNVHGCVGEDGRLSEDRVLKVLESTGADLIALQEVDVGRQRSNGEHQPEWLAHRLGMSFLFCQTVRFTDGNYGHALMSRHPLRMVHTGALPSLRWPPRTEARHGLWAEVTLPHGAALQIISTHLSIFPHERFVQASALCGSAWMSDPRFTGPRLLCGDINAGPRGITYWMLRRGMRDAQLEARRRPRATCPARRPLFRIDHVFVSRELRVAAAEVISSPAARLASDHLPLAVELESS